ncbi:isochorismatase family protein [Novosphingobium resinovorum]|uniref:isochorismatase family protein n=1 Tax=Novosphingobium resinovorum TaxID=158500 RepID=UPI002ED69A1F|nr:isochorismatase family protein [Novosphingobium resinovorum]
MKPVGTRMERSSLTAREYFETVMADPQRAPFGFGRRLAILNIDVQCAYTQIDRFVTAYETDPKQIDWINRLSAAARAAGLPVIWTRVAYRPDGSDCGVWGTRDAGPDALQAIRAGSERHAFDPRCDVDFDRDAVFDKRMASAFHETQLASLLVWHKIDTVVVTGGSTSGCVRATAVDALSHGYRTIVPIETTADKHESPHFASLTDLQLKYADVVPAQAVLDRMGAQHDDAAASS